MIISNLCSLNNFKTAQNSIFSSNLNKKLYSSYNTVSFGADTYTPQVNSGDTAVLSPKKMQISIECSKIMELLNQALQNKSKITLTQISGRTDISAPTVSNRIRGDKTLSEMWNSIQTIQSQEPEPLSTEEKQAQKRAEIREILTEAKEQNKKIQRKILAEKVGLTPDTVLKRIEEDDELIDLWESVRGRKRVVFTEEQRKAIESQVLSVVNEAKQNQQHLTYQDIADKTGVSVFVVCQILKDRDTQGVTNKKTRSQAVPAYSNWSSKRSAHKGRLYTNAELRAEDKKNKVLYMVYDAKKFDRKISYKEIERETGASKSEVIEILQNYLAEKAKYEKELAESNAKTLAALHS